MGLDYSLFLLGLSFASVYGVLPLFVHHLTPSNLALGLIAAVRSAGFLVPPILVAGVVERLRRKKPFVVGTTVMERLPTSCWPRPHPCSPAPIPPRCSGYSSP